MYCSKFTPNRYDHVHVANMDDDNIGSRLDLKIDSFGTCIFHSKQIGKIKIRSYENFSYPGLGFLCLFH